MGLVLVWAVANEGSELRCLVVRAYESEVLPPRKMNFPAKIIAERLPLFGVWLSHSPSSLRGLSPLNFTRSLHHSKGFMEFGGKEKMAWTLNGCNVGLDAKAGVILPGTVQHAEEAIGAVKAGKVIAVPTDTLYGFACDACSAEAVYRIYEIKGRKLTSPLAICVGDVWDIKRFAVTDHLPDGLLDSLLPGPVTVVLSRGESSILEKSLNPGLETIGVRVPDSDFIRVIARGSGSALALTSANLSGQQSSICIKDFEDLWTQCAFVFDGSLIPAGRAGSTVVDLVEQGKYKILRPGSAMEETVAILEKYSLLDGNEATA